MVRRNSLARKPHVSPLPLAPRAASPSMNSTHLVGSCTRLWKAGGVPSRHLAPKLSAKACGSTTPVSGGAEVLEASRRGGAA